MVTELLHSDMTQIVKEPSFLNGVVVLLRFLFVVIRFVTFWSIVCVYNLSEMAQKIIDANNSKK